METSIQVLALIHFTIIGFSHLFQPRAWTNFFIRLHDQGTTGVFVVGFMSLLVRLDHRRVSQRVVRDSGDAHGHRVGAVAQSAHLLLFSEFGLKRIAYVTPDRPHLYSVAGVVSLGIAALLGFHLWRSA